MFLSWNKLLSFRPLFLDVMIFSVPTIPFTQQAAELCSHAANQARQRDDL